MIAWLGSLLLALCAIPLVISTYQDGHVNGVNTYFLLMWAGGECLLLVHTIKLKDKALIFNYGFNVLLLTYILYIKFTTM